MDRVSNLPDEVLCHILVLALQCNSPLKEFSLKSFTVDDTDRVDGWISNVLARGVSDLDLKIIIRSDKWNFYPMSPKCFECSTLVKLSIGCGVDVTLAAGRIFLPMLKTLVLVWVKVCPNEFETLLRALPSLEKLVLLRVIWKGRDVIVSSASVKTLIVNLGFWLSTLSFDTPSLVHFDYSGSAAWDYPVVNMGNLVDTQIDFYLSQLHIKLLGAPGNDEDALPYSNAWKLFHGIRNVSHLSLFPDALEVRFLIQFLVHMTKRRSSFENVIPKYIVLFCLCFQVLSMCSESLPVFNNLNSLAIRSDKDRRWQAMPALLRNCPHLETLVIQGLVHHVTDKCGDVCDCISREDKGLSLKVCPVKVMEIYGFRGTMKEMAMIKHFLDYFPSLKEMEVYAEENNNPTQLGGNQRVLEMFKLYNKLSSCNVQLFI
ncbi:hypothetical protein BRARA_G01823 [Brassica rapa]|uniref:FBD domain-containing protein n=1 Tax=Brassica campestris TaxID=3711 RepID=A0A397YM92_BRACM|nr:hypothetical protein BRARA_G01823 [Brassica rapa]